MKRLAVGVFIMIAAPLLFSRASDTDLVISNSSGREAPVTLSAPDEPSNLSRRSIANGSAGGPAGTLAGYTLFRFDPKYGDISVQPIFGKINGAQICVSW